jgi:VanZ family protein
MFHRHPFLSLCTFVYLGFVGWVTLTPASEAPIPLAFAVRVLDALHRRGIAETLTINRLEFLANIGMFVPVGVFLLLLFGTGLFWVAGISSFVLTSAIETVQRSIPGRVSDPRDVVANTLGALIGIAIAVVLTLPATLRRRKRRRAEAVYYSA